MKLPYPRGGRCGRGRENKQNLFHNERIIPKPNRKVNISVSVSGKCKFPSGQRGPAEPPGGYGYICAALTSSLGKAPAHLH